PVEDGGHLLAGGIIDEQREKTAIELGLRQGISACLFNGVLDSHDKERLLRAVVSSAHEDAWLWHCLGQGRLVSWLGSRAFVSREAGIGLPEVLGSLLDAGGG